MNLVEYVIGKNIKFVPSSETLSLLSSPDTSITLTPACTRLLTYLISSQGQVLSRDTIFATLWEQYGYSPPNSSLNTYISLIRKALSNLGLEGEVITIVTVPKVVFLFNPDIPVETLNIELVTSAPAIPINNEKRQPTPET